MDYIEEGQVRAFGAQTMHIVHENKQEKTQLFSCYYCIYVIGIEIANTSCGRDDLLQVPLWDSSVADCSLENAALGRDWPNLDKQKASQDVPFLLKKATSSGLRRGEM